MWCPRDRNSEVDGPGLLSTRSFHCDACPRGPWPWRREEGGVRSAASSPFTRKANAFPEGVSPPGAAGHSVATGHRQAGCGPRATGAPSGRQEASRDSSPGPGDWAHVSSTHHNVGVLAGKRWGCCWAANEQGYSGPSEGPSPRDPRLPSPTAAPTRSSPFAGRPRTPLPRQHFASERFCPRPSFSLLGTCLDVWARGSLSTRS